MNKRVEKYTLAPLCLTMVLLGCFSAVAIHLDIKAVRLAKAAREQAASLQFELKATRDELQNLRNTYAPVFEVLSSEDVRLIKKINNVLSGDKEESYTRVSTAAVLASKLHSVPIETVLGVMSVESKFNADAVSPTHARGLMQLTSLIWEHYSQLFPEDKDVHDELMNALAGVHFLADLKSQYSTEKSALLHYWGGPTAVEEGGSYAELVLNQAKKWRDELEEELI